MAECASKPESMVSCGAKKGQATWRTLGCQSVCPPHAANMERSKNECPRPGSRMARTLRVRRANDALVSGAASGGQQAGSPADARNNEAAMASPEPPVYSEVCEHCGRDFRTKRGLGVHVRRAHPIEANNAIDVERVKARWPLEEIRLMAKAEATATSAGDVMFMNQHLHDKFPHRTLEAIKGKRRQVAYKEMVKEYLQDVDVDEVDVDEECEEIGEAMTRAADSPANQSHVSNVPGSEIPHQDDERVRNEIRELVELSSRFRNYEAQSLVNIARDSLVSGVVDVHAIERWLAKIFPAPKVQSPQRARQKPHSPPERRENKEQKRKREYAIVQNLYRKNKKACLSNILSGGVDRTRPTNDEFINCWRPIMEASSSADGDMSAVRELYRCERPRGGATQSSSRARGIHLEGLGDGATTDRYDRSVDKSSLWLPVTMAEISKATVRMSSAPGLDGVTVREWNAVPNALKCLLFNLLLLAREVPSSIAATRTVFLEKGGMPEVPAPTDYRPLSIGSVVLRHLHKILAGRITALKLNDVRQRGFQQVDGVCENVTVLSAILADARTKLHTVHIACVDVSKAFDTVSHKAIYRTLDELNLPYGFREYIRAVYHNARTVFKPAPGKEVSMIQLGRGVRQGDPLSPVLFNLVVDRALGILSEDVGYRIGNRVVNALGYADDIVLLASTRTGLQENLTRLQAAFQCCGLSMNAKKTGVLSLVASGRDKKVKVDMTPYFTVGGALIPQRSPVEIWTYLGNAYQGAREFATVPPLGQSIDLITRAPLKPQQRLCLLRDYLLPRLYHRWIVGSVTAKVLRGADITVRAAVRRWLRLPHDVPAGYFHASIRAGGLGLPMLKAQIPILKHNRLQRLCASTLPAACAAAETTYVARQLVWCENQMRVRGNRVATTSELRQQCKALLHESCDGSGLREVESSKLSSYWVSADAAAIPGADYVHYHHVRANCLPSRARLSRGRNGRDVRCRAGCPDIETPAHCVQRCFRTHGGRILRHNDLCRQVEGFLKQKGWHVDAELAYPTSAGRRRPDLTIRRGDEAVVLDAQVVSSETALHVAHKRKVEKYSANDDLVDRVAEHTEVTRNNVRCTALTISWRGVWSSESEAEMRTLGLTSGQLRTLTTRVLWGSWMNWKRFNSITTRYKRPEHQVTGLE